jgi:serine/threonine protein kinase
MLVEKTICRHDLKEISRSGNTKNKPLRPYFVMNHQPDFSSHGYRVMRELGRNREGGRVSYLAESLIEQRQVVIKQFRFAQENTNWQGFKEYEREIAILQKLKHPRIPRYLNSFETSDGFCMVQEYKDAPDLAQTKSFEPETIKKIIISVLEILDDLQQRIPLIIHRDIKPENILVDSNHRAYLIDFGLARVNGVEVAISSIMAGTPGFMPPEELFNRPLTTASDLYSLGATTIALLTNTSAVNISSLIDENYQFKFRHLLPGINPDFIDWLQKMVAANSKDRYANAAIALQALQKIDITGKATPKLQNIQMSSAIMVIGAVLAVSSAIAVFSVGMMPRRSINLTPIVEAPTSPVPITSWNNEQQWFEQIKPNCNAVEVVTAMNRSGYPKTPQGIGYAASCYALAGRIDLADRTIQQAPPDAQRYAAEVVFNIGHPVADAGDDKSAGPIMDLVAKYWPENYMAIYHAGMSHYILGEYPQATRQLQAFLKVYQQPDSWTAKAKSALSRMSQNIPADKSFSVQH